MYAYGLEHGEVGEHFLVLTDFLLMCEDMSSSYRRWTSQDHGNNGEDIGETRETHIEVDLPHSNYHGFWFFIMVG